MAENMEIYNRKMKKYSQKMAENMKIHNQKMAERFDNFSGKMT